MLNFSPSIKHNNNCEVLFFYDMNMNVYINTGKTSPHVMSSIFQTL